MWFVTVMTAGLKKTVFSTLGVILIAACDRAPSIAYETSTDPGGCLLEHVIVDSGVRYSQYDSFSSDGKLMVVAWSRGEERGTFIHNLETGERVELEEFNNGGGFSPDGKTIVGAVFMDNLDRRETEIIEFDRNTGTTTFVAPHEESDWLPSYSSDGNSLLFNSYRTGGNDIYSLDRDRGTLRRWTHFEGYEAHAQFSPGDSNILFHRNVGDGNYDLFVIDVMSGEITQLTDDATEEAYGSWSPSGETIVFASDRFQSPEITDLFLMNANGGDVRQLTNYSGKDAYPFFSPDGKYIYFNSDRELQGVYRITLDSNFNCLKSEGK